MALIGYMTEHTSLPCAQLESRMRRSPEREQRFELQHTRGVAISDHDLKTDMRRVAVDNGNGPGGVGEAVVLGTFVFCLVQVSVQRGPANAQ